MIKLPENPCAICRKREATQLCDYVIDYVMTSFDFKMTHLTCDLPMCKECSNKRGPFDFCKQHIEALKNADLKDEKLLARRNQHWSKEMRKAGR